MPFLCSKHKIYVRIYIRTAIFAHSRVPLKREPSGLLWGSSNKHIHIRRKGTTTTMSSSNKINIYVAHMLCASSVCIQHFMFSALGFLYLFGFLCLLCADAYIYICCCIVVTHTWRAPAYRCWWPLWGSISASPQWAECAATVVVAVVVLWSL